MYLHTTAYRPEAENALNVFDPKLNIAWPFPIGNLSGQGRTRSFIDPSSQGALL